MNYPGVGQLNPGAAFVAGGWLILEQMDETRRRFGKLLDAAGLGPIQTPSRIVREFAGLTLRAYAKARRTASAVVIIPAPIKRAYIWDLIPRASAVQQLMRGGFAVYLLEWPPPPMAAPEFGLADYADHLIANALEAIEDDIGAERLLLAGHSLGGTLAAIFAALHPEKVAGLVLLGAPLHFGADSLSSLLAVCPQVERFTETARRIPGTFLDAISLMAAPDAFGSARWRDWLASLPDAEAADTHLRVERWTFDEMPLARRFFAELIQDLYRADKLMRGTLEVGGRRAGPELVQIPLLNVVERQSAVAPPESVLPFQRAARSHDKRLIWYEGDTGVSLQHVGMLAGKTAHQVLWPEIVRWMSAHV